MALHPEERFEYLADRLPEALGGILHPWRLQRKSAIPRRRSPHATVVEAVHERHGQQHDAHDDDEDDQRAIARAVGVDRRKQQPVCGDLRRCRRALQDHVDGIDQRAFLEGKQSNSNRDGFPYWLGSELYGVKWRNFKLVLVDQKTLTDPALPLPNPHLVNLDTDPKEREPIDYPYLHTWVLEHTGKILEDFADSVKREPLIPPGAPLDYVPKQEPQK